MAHGAPTVAFADFAGDWPEWWYRGACHGSSVDFFDGAPASVTAAKAVCHAPSVNAAGDVVPHCPVIAECLAEGKRQTEGGFGMNDLFGVWGGQLIRGRMSPKDPNSRTALATPDVVAWHADGVKVTEIARRVNLDRKTIRNILATEGII